MKRRWVHILLLLLFTAGCGQTIQETVSPVIQESNQGGHKKVVIMPFSDYTMDSSPYGYWRRNVLLVEALQDELQRFGFATTMQEDVIGFLLERGIIREAEVNNEFSAETATLQAEMEKGWSDEMKGELARAIYQNVSRAGGGTDDKYWNNERLISLDLHSLRSIGNAFLADYVIRGRIIELSEGEEDSFNPLQTGVLPFFFKVGTRTVFGVAKSDDYEMIDKMAIGALMGSALAPDNFPINDKSTEVVGHPLFGSVETTNNAVTYNALVWGAVGGAVAHLAHEGGKVNRAVVQLRMVVQDAKTGQIIWANRSEMRVTPKSAYAEDEHDMLLAQAIKHAVGSLMQNFVATQYSGMCVRVDQGGSLSTYPRAGGGECYQKAY